MDAREEFDRRFKKFAYRYDLFAEPLRTHDGNGNPGPWIARFIAIERTSGPTSPAHVYQDTAKQYPTEDEARAAAMWLGLQWLEENG